MPWTDLGNLASPGFIVDPQSVDLNSGRQIDWPNVPAAYVQAESGKKHLPAGKVVLEQADGTLIPRPTGDVAQPAGTTLIGVLATSADEDSDVAALTGYGVVIGGVVYEELLPDVNDANWATAGMNRGALRDDLAAAGKGFVYETYEDNRS